MKLPPTPIRPKPPWQPLVVLLALSGALVWAYWPAFRAMAEKWKSDPQYSHGFLVPVFAAALLWLRRPYLAGRVLTPSWWCMLPLLFGVALHLPAAAFNFAFEFLEGLSLILTLTGLCLLLGGRPALQWAWPALVFLAFMCPLPFNVERLMALELRAAATAISTFLLQLMGFVAAAQGNSILLESDSVGVEEACSGLSMLITFVALSTAVVFTFDMPALDKGVILLSSVPIAIIANVFRIVGTAILMEKWDKELGYQFFHNWAGWLMMVFAFALLLLEMYFLRHLLIKLDDRKLASLRPIPLNLPR